MYLLFAGYSYYPSGGWKDFQGSFTSTEDAKTHLANSTDSYDWWHIVANGQIVEEGYRR